MQEEIACFNASVLKNASALRRGPPGADSWFGQ